MWRSCCDEFVIVGLQIDLLSVSLPTAYFDLTLLPRASRLHLGRGIVFMDIFTASGIASPGPLCGVPLSWARV